MGVPVKWGCTTLRHPKVKEGVLSVCVWVRSLRIKDVICPEDLYEPLTTSLVGETKRSVS